MQSLIDEPKLPRNRQNQETLNPSTTAEHLPVHPSTSPPVYQSTSHEPAYQSTNLLVHQPISPPTYRLCLSAYQSSGLSVHQFSQLIHQPAC